MSNDQGTNDPAGDEEQQEAVSKQTTAPEPVTYNDNALDEAEEWRPEVPAKAAPDGLKWSSQEKPKAVTWLWAEMIPRGQLSVIIGPGGVGKTSLIAGLIGRINQGVLDGDMKDKPSSVAFFNLESSASTTLAPKLLAAQATHCLIVDEESTAWRGLNLATDVGIAKLEGLIDEMDLKWIIFDPGLAFFRTNRSAQTNTAEVTVRLTPLAALAARKNVAITFVMHLKAGRTKVEVDSANAAMGFTNVARHALAVGVAGEDLVVGVIKSESTAKWGGYIFRLEYPAGVLFDDEGVDLTPSHLKLLGIATPNQVLEAWKRIEEIGSGTQALLASICEAIAVLDAKKVDATRTTIFETITEQWQITQKRFDSVIRDGFKRFLFADAGSGSGGEYRRTFTLLPAGKALVTPRPPSGNRRLHDPSTGPALRLLKNEPDDGSF